MKKIHILVLILLILLGGFSINALNITVNGPLENHTYDKNAIPINLTTDVPAMCNYSWIGCPGPDDPVLGNASIEGSFSISLGVCFMSEPKVLTDFFSTQHSAVVEAEGQEIIFTCIDEENNTNRTDEIHISINETQPENETENFTQLRIFNLLPDGIINTNITNLSLQTNIPSNCKYTLYDPDSTGMEMGFYDCPDSVLEEYEDEGVIPRDVAESECRKIETPDWFYMPEYSELDSNFSTSDNLNFTRLIKGFEDGKNYTFFVGCQDITNSSNEDYGMIRFQVNLSHKNLNITVNSPLKNHTYDNYSIPINLTTNKPATCSYSIGIPISSNDGAVGLTIWGWKTYDLTTIYSTEHNSSIDPSRWKNKPKITRLSFSCTDEGNNVVETNMIEININESEPKHYCGDSKIAPGIEECDGPNLNGQTCASLDYTSGNLFCNNDCTFNYSNCSMPYCSDGICNNNETCSSCPEDCGCSSGEECVDGECKEDDGDEDDDNGGRESSASYSSIDKSSNENERKEDSENGDTGENNVNTLDLDNSSENEDGISRNGISSITGAVIGAANTPLGWTIIVIFLVGIIGLAVGVRQVRKRRKK